MITMEMIEKKIDKLIEQGESVNVHHGFIEDALFLGQIRAVLYLDDPVRYTMSICGFNIADSILAEKIYDKLNELREIRTIVDSESQIINYLNN